MLYQEKLIEEPFSKYQVMKFLEKELDRAGLANVDIQRTPLVTRITLEVTNPARIIGKRGRLINELTFAFTYDGLFAFHPLQTLAGVS